MISVAEAAEKLEVHRTRINQLIDTGQLPATRIGRAYAIRVADLDLVKDRPTVGRPKKEDEASGAAAVPTAGPTPKAPATKPKSAATLTPTQRKKIMAEPQRRWAGTQAAKTKAGKKGMTK